MQTKYILIRVSPMRWNSDWHQEKYGYQYVPAFIEGIFDSIEEINEYLSNEDEFDYVVQKYTEPKRISTFYVERHVQHNSMTKRNPVQFIIEDKLPGGGKQEITMVV